MPTEKHGISITDRTQSSSGGVQSVVSVKLYVLITSLHTAASPSPHLFHCTVENITTSHSEVMSLWPRRVLPPARHLLFNHESCCGLSCEVKLTRLHLHTIHHVAVVWVTQQSLHLCLRHHPALARVPFSHRVLQRLVL